MWGDRCLGGLGKHHTVLWCVSPSWVKASALHKDEMGCWIGRWKTNRPLGVSWTPSTAPFPTPAFTEAVSDSSSIQHALLHFGKPALKRGSRSWLRKPRLLVFWLLRSPGIFFFSKGLFQLIPKGFWLLFSPPIGGSRCPAMPRRCVRRLPCCPGESDYFERLG